MSAVTLQGQGRDYLRGSSRIAQVPALPSTTVEFKTEFLTPSWVVIGNFMIVSVGSRTARNASYAWGSAFAKLSADADVTLLSTHYFVSGAHFATSSFITSRPVPRAMSIKWEVAPPFYGASRTFLVSSFVVFLCFLLSGGSSGRFCGRRGCG